MVSNLLKKQFQNRKIRRIGLQICIQWQVQIFPPFSKLSHNDTLGTLFLFIDVWGMGNRNTESSVGFHSLGYFAVFRMFSFNIKLRR